MINEATGKTAIFGDISLSKEQLEKLNLDKATLTIIDAYHRAGYSGGSFENSKLVPTEEAIVLEAPKYARFMLWGRGPGKMPPIEPIAGWCSKVGIEVSPWAVAMHIAKHGTKGNDFLTPIIPVLSDEIAEQIANLLAEEMTSK